MDQDTTSKQVSTLVGLKIKSKRLPTWFTNFLQTHFNRFLGFTQFNDTYSQLPEQENQRLSKVALDRMNIKLIHSGEPLSSIPLSGPQIFVANHPHGLVDGFALDHLIASQRPDTKIMAMYALGNIPEYEETLILVDPMKKRSRQSLNVGSWRKVYKQVSSGGALVVFPAGAVSRYQPSHNRVKDSDWSPHIAAIARRTGATVIPLFIHGRNDLAFQISGFISRSLQNLLLFSQFQKMRDRSVHVTVGKPLLIENWRDIPSDEMLINHFREKVEILGQS